MIVVLEQSIHCLHYFIKVLLMLEELHQNIKDKKK